MSSLFSGHFGLPERERASQIRAGLGAFLFALAGAATIWLSVLYVNRGAIASGPSSNRLLSYQVSLSDVNGIALTGTQEVILNFYTVPTGGTPIHTDCGTVGTPVARKAVMDNGTATIIIGDAGADASHDCVDSSAPNVVPASLFSNTSLYLGVTVGADAEMTPRKRIVSTGYAANADLLDDLDTSAVGGSVAFVPVTDSSGNLVLTKNFTVDTATLYVDAATDRVGMGTISPLARLHLAQTATAGTGTLASSGGNVTGTGTLFLTEVSAGDSIIASGETRLVKSVSSNTALAIDEGFTTSLSGAAFTVSKPLFSAVNADGAQSLFVGRNVGIGTATPSSPLDVRATKSGTSAIATANYILQLQNESQTDNSLIGITFSAKNTSASGQTMGDLAFIVTDHTTGSLDSDFVLLTRNADSLAERFRLKNNGNLGLGTSSPLAKLDVVGDIASSSAIRDAIAWIQNQGGADKLRLGYNNGGAGASATPSNTAMRTADVEHYDAGASDSLVEGFRGAIFDGRYVYFIPYYYSKILRYDTSGTFSSSSSWTTFDFSAVSASFCSEGAAFDGRYMYLAPCSGGGANGITLRYDTTAAFTTVGSWTSFDMATVNAAALGYDGVAFDGRYAYFIPRHNGTATHGVVMRYDTTASFTTGASWSSFDATTVNANSKGFEGAVFDGRYLYLAPNSTTSLVTRYDTTGTFTSSGSWSAFDQTTVNANAKGFKSAVYDGRYVYYVPYFNGAYHANLLRYDTSGSFTATTSWSHVDISSFNASAKGFSGATFDGRYMHFVPYWNGSPDGSGVIARLDTAGTYTASSAWSFLDIETIDGSLEGFSGAAFDGRHIYLVPLDNSVDDGENGRVARLRVWAGGTDSTSNVAKIARSQELFIDSSGKVGIGTVTPAVTLHTVVQQPSATNGPNANSYSAARFMVQTSGGGPERGIELGAPTSAISDAPVYVKVQGSSNRFGILNEDNVERLSISSFGNVGIGSTLPAAKLDVVGGVRVTGRTTELSGDINPTASTAVTGVNTRFTDELVVGDRITVSGETRTVVAIASNTSLTVDTAFTDTPNDATPDAVFALATIRDSSNAIKLTMSDLGNIGIGTILPTTELQVSGTTDVFRIADPTATSYVSQEWEVGGSVMGRVYGFGASYATSGRLVANSMLIDSTASGGLGLSSASSGPINFYTATAQRMTIESGGNVGIGDATPASLFTVGSGDMFRVDSSGNVTTLGDIAVEGGDLTTSTPTFNVAAGATTVNLAGGSGSTGCTIDGSGNLTCAGTVTGGGLAFNNGGNSFGGAATLGTNDAFGLSFETSGTSRLTIDSAGAITATGSLDVAGHAAFGSSAAVSSGTTLVVGEAVDGTLLSSIALSATLVADLVAASDIINLYGSQLNVLSDSGDAGNYTGGFYGQNINVTHEGSGTFGGGLYGINVSAVNYGSGTGNGGLVTGITTSALNGGSLNTSTVTGNEIYYGVESTGNSTTARGLLFWPTFSGGGDVTTASSIYVSVPTISGGSTVATSHGIYLENQTGATTNYALYSAGGQSYHAGNFGIGDVSPDTLLDVTGAGSSDGILIDNTAATGDPIVGFQLSGTSQFTMGVDDSTTNDDFVISDGSVLGTNDRLTIDGSTGAVSVTQNLTVDSGTLFVDSSANTVSINSLTPVAGSAAGLLTITESAGTNIPLVVHMSHAIGPEFYTHSNTGFRAPTISLLRSEGTATAPTALSGAVRLGYIGFSGHDGSGYFGGSEISSSSSEAWSGSAHGTDLYFSTTASGTTTLLERLRLAHNGNIGINTVTPLSRLDLFGNLRTTGKATAVLTGSIDPAASTTVTGVGTLFTTELVVGDRIAVTGETRTVTAIASATSLTVDTAFTDNANDTSPDVLYAMATMRDSSNTVRFMVNDLGNVGIGDVTPSVTLDVSGTATSDFVTAVTNLDTAATADGLSIAIGPATNPGTGNSFISFKDGSGAVIGQVQGDGAGGVTYNQTSDARLKENVVAYSDALTAVNAMRVMRYNMITAPGREQVGFIAQELYEILPQVVGVGGDDPRKDPWGVDYGRITPVLARAIQELDAKLVALAELNAENVAALGAFSTPYIDVEKVTADVFVVRRTDERKTIGDAVLPSGETFVQVHDDSIEPSSKVFFSFRKNPGSYGWVEEVGDGVFVLKVAQPTVEDVTFDYWIIGVQDDVSQLEPTDPVPENVPTIETEDIPAEEVQIPTESPPESPLTL